MNVFPQKIPIATIIFGFFIALIAWISLCIIGLIPICANCKKIRDDKGYWTQVEEYVRAHSEAEFSHGICPECIKKLYPDFVHDI